jgi:reversibly glycosylated polypeptide/UDP-arabinopyranose mutase
MLVLPSIRKDSFDRFVREWSSTDLFLEEPLILMEDNPRRTFDVSIERTHYSATHFSWKDIVDSLEEKSWIIPRRSDTVRSFGYWYANMVYQEGNGDTITYTLDDDCYPLVGHDFLTGHRNAIFGRTRWFNTLNSGRPRGIPYKNLGAGECVLNHGLWQGVLDFDAPTQLRAPFEEQFSHDNREVPLGSYFPMCGMNVAWQTQYGVLMYHLLMGCVDVHDMPEEHRAEVVRRCPRVESWEHAGEQRALYRLPLDRFGDIWCGIIMKKICDHLGLSVSTGTPYIHHDRASDPFKNLVKEAVGIGLNEIFWDRVDQIELSSVSPAKTYEELGAGVRHAFDDTEYGWYFRMLGDAMVAWARLHQ